MNKGVIAVIVVFFGFWMLHRPARRWPTSAGSAGDALWGWTQELFTSVIDFVGDL